MLKIVGSRHVDGVLVRVDPFVPLTIELQDDGCSTPLYWRGRTDDGSLVEVAVSPEDGTLRSITVTSIPKERVVRSIRPLGTQTSEAGIPQADLSLWPAERREFAENFVDEMVPLQLLLGGSNAILWFCRSPEPASWHQAGDVLFGVTDDGFLSCIEVRALSDEQLDTIWHPSDESV